MHKVVLHLSSNRWNSAITEYVISNALAFQKNNYESHMLLLCDSFALKRATKLNLKTDAFDYRSYNIPLNILKLNKYIHSLNPDIIVSYGGSETFLLANCSINTNKTTLVRFVGYNKVHSKFLFKKKWNFIHKNFDYIIFPSATLKEKFSYLENSKTKYQKIVLGINENNFQFNKMLSKDNESECRPKLLIFGRLDPVKGHEKFMKIFKLALDKWPKDMLKPILKIVGREENLKLSNILNYAKKNNLELGRDLIIDIASIDDVAKLLQKSDLGIISSIDSEVICRVAQEFLLVGTPVLVSGVGSLDEVLMDDDVVSASYGDLADEKVAELLIRTIISSVQENSEQKMTRANLANIQFSITAMAKELAGLDKLFK